MPKTTGINQVKCIVENTTRTRISEKELERMVSHTMKVAGKNVSVSALSIYIHIVGRRRCAQLNKKFRGIDKPTDVLSFAPPTPTHRGISAADIVLCPEIIKRHAKKEHLTFANELAHVTVHGMLHVLGFHHEQSKAQERTVKQKENITCKALGYGVPHPEIKTNSR